MAVVLTEGFDHLTATTLTTKAWNANPTSMQAGRFDGQCARLSTGSATIQKVLPSTYSTLIYGFALRSSIVTVTGDFAIIKAGGTNVCRLSYNGAGLIRVLNSGGTVIATGTTTITTNSWIYVEVKLVVGTSGTVEVHLNGAAEIASTVGNFGTTNVDTVQVLQPNNTGNWDYDDIYVVDTTGSSPRNTFLGDVRVETIYPTADGAHTDWTPDTAGTHFSRVNEDQANGDTSYVSDSTPGDLDTYTFGDIDGAATVYAVQTNLYARKDDANVRQIAPVVRQSGTDNVGTTVTLSASYVDYTQLYNQDPTSADWTAANVNADEFGVKEIA